MFPFCRPFQTNGTSTETARLSVPPERDATDREGKPQTGPLPGKTKREHLPDHHQQRQPPFFQPHPTIAAGRTSTGHPIRTHRHTAAPAAAP